ARLAFRAARASYKRVECLLEVFGPGLASQLKGPPPEEEEDRPNLPLGAPAGFQIIESALFPGGAPPSPDSVRATVAAMERAVRGFRPLTNRIEIGDADVLDAMRLEWA